MTIRSQSIYDVSMPAYGIMCMLIYYFTLRYIPNELIENTLSLIIKDMNSGIVCFDNRGRCIYCNDILKNIYNIGTEYIDADKKDKKAIINHFDYIVMLRENIQNGLMRWK